MRRALAVAALLAAGGAGGYVAFAPDAAKPNLLVSEAERFCRLCEEELKSRLAHPDSYQRQACTDYYTEPTSKYIFVSSQAMPGQGTLAYSQLPQDVRADFEKNGRESFVADLHYAFIAAESDDTPADWISQCRLLGPVGSTPTRPLFDRGVDVDGLFHDQWKAQGELR